jgi:hypothetical protein
MSVSTRARRITGVVAWLIAFHVLLAYGLPEGLFIGLVIGLGVLYWRAGAMAAATVSMTLVLVTVMYWATLKATGFEDRIYYRPDEKYVVFDYDNNHRRYESSIHIEADMPHGDLRAMTTDNIAEPRHITFHTDRDGFRNEQDYHGQRFLLIGDSFAAGSSNSHEDALVSQLKRTYKLDTYSLAYPGSPADYLAYLQGFLKRHPGDVRVLLFVFEGNDFEESRGRPEHPVARYGRRYYEMFSGLNTYRVTKSLIKRFTRSRTISEGSGLLITELAGQKLAFYQRYVNVTRQTALPPPEGFEEVFTNFKPYLQQVYFIPTKYRVYHQHVQPGEKLPNAQWDYLDGVCRQLGLHCTNLTAALVQESDALLKRGEFTWWRDDTHWNRNGIAVAARIVATDLNRAMQNSTTKP